MSASLTDFQPDWNELAEWLDPDLATLKMNPGQSEGLIALKPFIANGERCFVEMPPRSGKSAMFLTMAEIFSAATDYKSKILILTSAEHLREQIMEDAAIFAPQLMARKDIIELDEGQKLPAPLPPVTIATYEMIIGLVKTGRLSMNDFHLVVEDEGHLTLTDLRKKILEVGVPSGVRHVAFTGTSEYFRKLYDPDHGIDRRIEKSLASAGFTEAYKLPFADAQAMGIIRKHRSLVLDIHDRAFAIDGSGTTANGDFVANKIDPVVNQAKMSAIMANFILKWQDPQSGLFLRDMVGIAACNSVDHAKNFAATINAMHFSMYGDAQSLCEPVWGAMPRQLRKDRIAAHKDATQKLLSCDRLLLTGYDNRHIQYILNIAPTRSGNLAAQRGSRPLTSMRDSSDTTGLVIEVAYPGIRNEQVFFNDTIYGGENTQRAIQVLDFANSGKTRPKRQVEEPTDFEGVKVHYTEAQMDGFTKRRELELLLEHHPDLSVVSLAFRDRMINKHVYTIKNVVSGILGSYKIAQWRLTSPKAFVAVTKRNLTSLLRGHGEHEVWANNSDGQHLYHPAATALAAYFSCTPKEIFGPLSPTKPDEPLHYTYERLERLRNSGIIMDVSGLPHTTEIDYTKSPAPSHEDGTDNGVGDIIATPWKQLRREFPKDTSRVEHDPIDVFDGRKGEAPNLVEWIYEHLNPPRGFEKNPEAFEFYRQHAEELMDPTGEPGDKIPSIDEFKAGRYQETNDAGYYDADGLPVDRSITKASNFPVVVDDRPLLEGGTGKRPKTTVVDIWDCAERAGDPLDQVIASDLAKQLDRVVSTLTPREERVLRMRFGLGVPKESTLEEVGDQFNVTRERIRQIETKAIRKLKHPSRSRVLVSFLDP